MHLSQSSLSTPPSKPGRRRLLLVLCVIAIAAGLLVTRPWQGPQVECSLTVQRGESIQEAINAAAAGDVICLARGTWIESIVIDKPLTLVGRGAGRTTIEAARCFSPVVQVSGQGSQTIDVKLEGLAISGDGGASGVTISGAAVAELRDCVLSGRAYGIEVADSAHVTLRNSTITQHKQRGVIVVDSAQAHFTGSRISANLGLGVWVSGSAEVTFLDCEISANRGHGLWLRDEARLVLTNSLVSKNEGHGLWLTGQSAAYLLQSRIAGNSDQGIGVEDRATIELTDSDVLLNWHGIELGYEARATVVNSAVSSNRWDGIRIQDFAKATISRSMIFGNTRGVGLTGQAEADVTDCLIKENSGYGVFSWFSAKAIGGDNEFRDNGIDLGGNLAGTLRLPLTESIETAISWPDERYESLQEAVDALLPGGKILLAPGTYTAGLTIGKALSIEAAEGQVVLKGKSNALPVLSLVDGAELRLLSTTVSEGSTGLALSASARAVLIGCSITDNAEGINLSYASSLELVDCAIAGNARGGIFVGGAAQAAVTGCTISNHKDYGIVAAGSAQVKITSSELTRNGWDGAVVLWDSCEVVLERNSIVDNRGFGVAVSRGWVSGRSNTFRGNMRGDLFPPDLGFLATAEGGEFDMRPSLSA